MLELGPSGMRQDLPQNQENHPQKDLVLRGVLMGVGPGPPRCDLGPFWGETVVATSKG